MQKVTDPAHLFGDKGDPIGVTKWAQKNPAEAAAAAAIVAAPFTMGGSLAGLGAAGAAEGAGALGAGAAGMTALDAAPLAADAGAGAAGGLLSAAPDLAGYGSAMGLAPEVAAQAPQAAQFGASVASSGPTFGPDSLGGMVDATQTGMPGAPSNLPMGNAGQSPFQQFMNRGQDALKSYNKVQTANNLMNPQQQHNTTVSRPPSMMNQQPPQSLGGSFGSSQPLFGGSSQGGPDAAKLMILKRMGLLGGMQ